MSQVNTRSRVGAVFVTLVGISILLTACSAGSSPDKMSGVTQIISTKTPGQSPEAAVQAQSDPTDEVDGDDNPEQAGVPTPRAGLESTDPATVHLASGDIQLIEFFAFW